MDKLPEDKTIPPGADARPAAQPDAGAEKSWGDKYKHKLHHFIRDILVNYVVNFSMSALGTYAVVNTNFYKNTLITKRDIFSETLKKATGIPSEFTKEIASFFTVTQLLLCGGHALLPYLKWSHDNRKRQEFELGHKLDVMQQSLGRGDDATRQRLEEYKYIKDLLKANRPQDLSDNDKILLAKNCIDDNLQFKERRQSWKQVLKSRGLGVVFTTTLSFVLATGTFLGAKLGKPWLNVKERYLEGWGGKFGEKAYAKLPISDKKELGALTFLELIYTLLTKLGFDHMEKHQLQKQEQQERMEAEAAVKIEREKLFPANPGSDAMTNTQDQYLSPPAPDARRKILEGGERDFRARETAKPAETGMALS